MSLIKKPDSIQQFRAIGLIKGSYLPSESDISKGILVTSTGSFPASIIGNFKTHVFSKPNILKRYSYYVCYFKTVQGSLVLQLKRGLRTGNYNEFFSVRGVVRFNQDKKIVIGVRSNIKNDYIFDIEIKGKSKVNIGDFVEVKANREKDTLKLKKIRKILSYTKPLPKPLWSNLKLMT